MKRLLFIVLMVVMIAITVSGTEQKSEPVVRKCYVDSDKNGICDKYERKICKSGSGTGTKDCIKPK